ncbi:MAG: transcription antitermination factor NusB [Ginsengibacter sp.]
MISRRIIRVKVMQALYSIDSRGGDAEHVESVKYLKHSIDQTRHLLVYLVNFILEIARYSEVDAQQKSGKHLPSKSDLNTSTRIAGNDLVLQLTQQESFKKACVHYKLSYAVDGEMLRKLYRNVVASDEYKNYTSIAQNSGKDDKKILEFVFNEIMMNNDDFINHIEDLFLNWDDDTEMIAVLINTFFQKPLAFDFNQLISAEKWEFAEHLLKTVLDKKAYCLELITPKLNNWDAERIAALDMILMQMGVCEFLYFETIPTKVTINEYIDLAKDYSTPQSGHFVNGVLDNIRKDLVESDKIHKKNFKNSTL